MLFYMETSSHLLKQWYHIFQLPCSFPEMCNGLQSGIAFDCNAGLVALRTENYCIQLYSLFDDRGISEVTSFLLDEKNVLLGVSECPR